MDLLSRQAHAAPELRGEEAGLVVRNAWTIARLAGGQPPDWLVQTEGAGAGAQRRPRRNGAERAIYRPWCFCQSERQRLVKHRRSAVRCRWSVERPRAAGAQVRRRRGSGRASRRPDGLTRPGWAWADHHASCCRHPAGAPALSAGVASRQPTATSSGRTGALPRRRSGRRGWRPDRPPRHWDRRRGGGCCAGWRCRAWASRVANG